jgi:hypothetical protein
VHSFSLKQGVPSMLEIMRGLTTDMGGVYSPLGVLFEPETEFAYSGGGFLMLQHVLELLWRAPIAQAMRPFMLELGMTEFLVEDDGSIPLFPGTADDGSVVPRRAFPPLAAGMCSSREGTISHLRCTRHRMQLPRHCAVSQPSDRRVPARERKWQWAHFARHCCHHVGRPTSGRLEGG